MHHPLTTLLLAASAISVSASPITTEDLTLTKRAFSFPIPASKGSVTYSSAQKISGVFDGGLKTYGRGVSCTGQAEGGDSDSVFLLADGATLQNAIIGKDQIEGVHCLGGCTIKSMFFWGLLLLARCFGLLVVLVVWCWSWDWGQVD